MTVGSGTVVDRRRAAAPARRELALEQLGVLAGQLGAGAGNLVFSLVMARLLYPDGFAAFASFGALYLLLNMPVASLTAVSALNPALELRLRRLATSVGAAFGVLLAVLAVPVAHLLHLSVPLVLLLAAAAPGAGPLALARGRLYGTGRRRGLVASLVAEPLGRLALGSWLAPLAGPAGGGLAIVAAGYLSLAVARRAIAREQSGAGAKAVRTGRGAGAAFLLLAVLQTQDLVLGNAVLGREQAAIFAVLSTLGGIAAFATSTVPMVLLSRADGQRRGPLAIALALAGVLGAATVAIAAVAPGRLVSTLFGSRYEGGAGLVVPYLGAMALLGLARVLVAQRCAEGRGRPAIALLAGATALQSVLIVALAHSAAGVVYATLAATATVATVAAVGAALELPAVRRAQTRALVAARSPTALAVLGLTLVGIGLRLLITRGLWIDEATSVTQAQMPFGAMLHDLRTTDVHPPLYFALLWLDVRVFGVGELAVRLPSILAGALLVPALYATGRDLYDRRAGLAAAALAVIAPQAIWYSQEARMYALFMLLAVLAVWGQARALRSGRARDWTLYTAATVALLWTQYFSILLIALQQAAFVAIALRRGPARRRLLRAWAASAAVFVILVAPLAAFAYRQFEVNQASGRGFGSTPSQTAAAIAGEHHLSLYEFLANAVWAVWGYHADATMVDLVALWPLAILLTLFLLGRGWSQTSTLLVAIALLPALALFAIGQSKSDLFDLRYFIGSVPAALLLAGRGLTAWSRSSLARIGLAVAFAASMLGGLVDQQLNRDNPRRYDFRGSLRQIEQRASGRDLVLYNPSYLSDVVRYYAPELDARPLARGLPATRRAGHVFLVGSFFDLPLIAADTRDAVRRLARSRGVLVHLRGSNVEVWEFR